MVHLRSSIIDDLADEESERLIKRWKTIGADHGYGGRKRGSHHAQDPHHW